MSYVDKISACNRHDLRRFLPLAAGGTGVGFVRKDRVPRLLDLCESVHPTATGLEIRTGPDVPDERTRVIDTVCEELRSVGELASRHGERYPAVLEHGETAAFTIDRSAVSYFGLRAFGVHLNGYVRTARGISMWLAQRSKTKPTWPGMLDQLVAGGQPAGISLADNLVKECAEEAAIPADLANLAVPVGSIRYCMEHELGLKPDEMFCYDLEVPEDFVPRAVDGEVERFVLVSVEEVRALVRDTNRIKPNCNLVILDFLIRHRILDTKDEESARLSALLRPRLPVPG